MKSKIHIFSENLLLSILTFFKVLIKSKIPAGYPKRNLIRNHLLIIGNGPSLNDSIDKILTLKEQGFEYLVVNYFAFSDLFEKLKPSIYVIAAPEFWLQDVDNDYKDKRQELFQRLVDRVNWDLYLYVPFEARKRKFWIQILKKNERIKIIYFNNTPVEGFFQLNKIYFKLNLGMCRPHNIIIPSLFIAINLGFKNIYLIGVEHGWLPNIIVNEKNEVLIKQDHFYDKKEAIHKPMRKLGKGERRLHEVLEKFYLTFKGYFDIRKYAELKNSRIYNLTINSYIDAFEKIHIDKIDLINDKFES